MSDFLISSTRSPTKSGNCFVYVFWCTISSWKMFRNSDSTNWIYVNIHVEKTFKALHCQMCGKYLKKKQRITKHLEIRHNFFWFSVEDIKISDIFYKIQNFLGTLNNLLNGCSCFHKLVKVLSPPCQKPNNWLILHHQEHKIIAFDNFFSLFFIFYTVTFMG